MDAAGLADVLRGVAREPGDAWLWGPLAAGQGGWVDAQGLTVQVALGGGGELNRVGMAQRDGEVIWSWGCERNWMELGPPINPADLLSAEEREVIGRALMALPSAPMCGPMGWDFDDVGRRQLNWQRVQKAEKRRKRVRARCR